MARRPPLLRLHGERVLLPEPRQDAGESSFSALPWPRHSLHSRHPVALPTVRQRLRALRRVLARRGRLQCGHHDAATYEAQVCCSSACPASATPPPRRCMHHTMVSDTHLLSRLHRSSSKNNAGIPMDATIHNPASMDDWCEMFEKQCAATTAPPPQRRHHSAPPQHRHHSAATAAPPPQRATTARKQHHPEPP